MRAKIRSMCLLIFLLSGVFWWTYSVYVGLNRPTSPNDNRGFIYAYRVHREVVYISHLEDIALSASAYLAILTFFVLAILYWRPRKDK